MKNNIQKSVLIVEDNVILAENFERILKHQFCVVNARSAASAIELVDNKIPDFIVLDILLEGHSAFALLNELQSYTDTSIIPVVICSDLAPELDLNVLKKYGVREVLDKSKMQPSDLLKVLRRLKYEADVYFSNSLAPN